MSGSFSLATPAGPPWTDRRHPVRDDDPRDAFSRDRDRILHSQAFRRLQHKTQVYIIHEGDFYRTRLTHTLEVAQIARSLAVRLGLCETLAEAIALAHDLGHVPFGHAGERALDELLRGAGDPDGWDSNRHSLEVVDELEEAYPDHPGLNLTFAVRQGIARHRTPFDRPARHFDSYCQPTPEAQVVNLADIIAYCAHDIQDAIEIGLLQPEALAACAAMELWSQAWSRAQGELGTSLRAAALQPAVRARLLAVRARRHLIDFLIRDVWSASLQAAAQAGVRSCDDAVRASEPVVRFSPDVERKVGQALEFLVESVYRSPMVARLNYRGEYVLRRLFDALVARPELLPLPYRALASRPRAVALYLASLTDRGAVDLFQELFDPAERVVGRHRA